MMAPATPKLHSSQETAAKKAIAAVLHGSLFLKSVGTNANADATTVASKTAIRPSDIGRITDRMLIGIARRTRCFSLGSRMPLILKRMSCRAKSVITDPLVTADIRKIDRLAKYKYRKFGTPAYTEGFGFRLLVDTRRRSAKKPNAQVNRRQCEALTSELNLQLGWCTEWKKL
jgi:hypothetical protein